MKTTKALAALLMTVSLWLLQDGCGVDDIGCNMAYLKQFFTQLSNLIASVGVAP